MAWVLDKTIDFTVLVDTPAASTLALIGMACASSANYYIAGGRLRSHHNPSSVPVLYLAGSDAFARHKVVLTADAPTLDTALNQNQAVNILTVDHYLPSSGNLFYACGFSGATNFGPINGVNFAIPGNVIAIDSHAIGNPLTEFTITMSNTFSDGSTTSITVITNGDNLSVDGLTQQPANGFAGLVLSGKDQTQSELQGVSLLEIYHWEIGSELEITTPTGSAELTSATHLHVEAPTYTPGDSNVHYSWQYHTTYNGTATAISGQSGTLTGATPIPDLEWDIPSELQNAYLWVTVNVHDDSTTYAAQGYFDGVFAIGSTGVYVPVYAPAPVKPNNAALQALWTPPSSSKLVWLILGDSIRWQWSHSTDQIQLLVDTIWGAGKVLVLNGGNPGATIANWFQGQAIIDGQPTASQIPGYDTYNNYMGAYHAAVDNLAAGDRLVVSIALGTNYPSPIGTYFADIDTLIEQLAVTYDGLVTPGRTVPMTLHDLPTYRYNQFQSVEGTIYEPLLTHYRYLESLFGNNGWLYKGERNARPYFMTHRSLMQTDGIHPDTDQGNDAVMRFDLEVSASVFAESFVTEAPNITNVIISRRIVR